MKKRIASMSALFLLMFAFALANDCRAVCLCANFNSCFEQGVAASDQGDWNRSIDCFLNALPYAEGQEKSLTEEYIASTFNNRGFEYYEKFDHESAMDDFNKAIRTNPDLADAYFNRGLVYDDTGDYDRAIEDYSMYMDMISEDDAAAYNNRAVSYSNTGDYGRALDDYNRALELDPNEGLYYLNITEEYIHAGNLEKALKHAETAVEDYSSYLDKNYKYDFEVLKLFHKELKSSGAPPAADDLLERAAAALDAGDHEQALILFQAYYWLQPKSADAVYNIATCHQKRGRPGEAILWFYRYLYLAPDAENRDKVMETIQQLVKQV